MMLVLSFSLVKEEAERRSEKTDSKNTLFIHSATIVIKSLYIFIKSHCFSPPAKKRGVGEGSNK